ncbi:hypothetical protein MWG98_05970 [Klebsiella quasipneumoniae]|jgi:hypothetical protein|uniref:hypothetical protein n=1 Tax=Klebsiella quasipneumoniae TaxID=1463165 RepID=UPI001FF14F78|nr:hypothetical protein [Klebsiella quasipneumoniae]MCJ8555677.1 hypothetical protein [Klebsiella quasipneumoniae]HCD1361573.1 hypothetical protein [Klebsiella pneumoniae subsp. pneumoniae]
MILNADGADVLEVQAGITEEQIEEMAYSYGRPYKYYKYSYFYQNENVIPIAFESIQAEIKFWHVIDRLQPSRLIDIDIN